MTAKLTARSDSKAGRAPQAREARARKESDAPQAPPHVRVDIWSDLVCPWCWIAKRRLERTIARESTPGEVVMVFRSYELIARTAAKEPAFSAVATKHAGHEGEYAGRLAPIARLAAELDLKLDFEHALVVPTFDAHRLVQAAKQVGVAAATIEALHRAHFSEGQDLTDHAVLRAAGREGGLPEREIRAVLTAGAYASEVEADEAEARARGVTGIPYVSIDGAPGVGGEEAVGALLRALEKLRRSLANDGAPPSR